MQHNPENWARPRDDIYGSYDMGIANAASANKSTSELPKTHTQQPIVTGTSVLGLKFSDGVILSADNLASYGSLARFDNVERLIQVGKYTVVGISGDISDLQYIEEFLNQLEISEENQQDGHDLRPNNVFEYLSRVMYQRRSKMNPLWNAILVGGINRDETPFLAYVDLLGVTYSAPSLATGFGAHLAVPLLRQAVSGVNTGPPPDEHVDLSKAITPYDTVKVNLTKSEARSTIDKCMKVLYYRDARSLDKYTVATITSDGIHFDYNVKCQEMSWRFAGQLLGYGHPTA